MSQPRRKLGRDGRLAASWIAAAIVFGCGASLAAQERGPAAIPVDRCAVAVKSWAIPTTPNPHGGGPDRPRAAGAGRDQRPQANKFTEHADGFIRFRALVLLTVASTIRGRSLDTMDEAVTSAQRSSREAARYS